MCRKWISQAFLIVLFALPALAADPADSQQATATQAAAAEQPTVGSSRCQICGDGFCAPSCENERTCPADCGPKAAAARCGKCGDGQCVRQCGETPETCPADCGYGSPSAAKDGKTPKCEPAPAAEPKKE